MKWNVIILLCVIGLAVYVGLRSTSAESLSITTSFLETEDLVDLPIESSPNSTIFSLSERRKSFDKFYTEVHKFVTFLEEIDETTTRFSEQNPSPIKQYEYFSKVKDSMEEGQQISFASLIPKGFSDQHQDYMDEATTNLYRAYQYRKFAAEHYLIYLEDDSLAALDEAKGWMVSSNSELLSAVVLLESVKLELDEK